ncbi:hypothetical protein Tco_1090275 [Tanacetum coccineum]|uniref:Uncharacterized protein n=1 Tax=Tanacetum coccineum TaxID=301880 RepID=A0ABQ5I3Q4_9ASTR
MNFRIAKVMNVGEIRSLSLPHKVNHRMALLISLPKYCWGNWVTDQTSKLSCDGQSRSEMEQKEAKGEAMSTKEPVQADIWYRNLWAPSDTVKPDGKSYGDYIYKLWVIFAALTSAAVHKLWKWKQNAGNLFGKSADKLSSMIWEEKHEQDGPRQICQISPSSSI